MPTFGTKLFCWRQRIHLLSRSQPLLRTSGCNLQISQSCLGRQEECECFPAAVCLLRCRSRWTWKVELLYSCDPCTLQNSEPGAFGADDEQGNGVLEIIVRNAGWGNGEALTMSWCFHFQMNDRLWNYFFFPHLSHSSRIGVTWINWESCLFNTEKLLLYFQQERYAQCFQDVETSVQEQCLKRPKNHKAAVKTNTKDLKRAQGISWFSTRSSARSYSWIREIPSSNTDWRRKLLRVALQRRT